MPARSSPKTILRWSLTVLMIAGGVNHAISPDLYVAMMPEVLPAPLALVYLSGAFEVLGGAGLVLPATRRWAAWGLVALLVAVFPANVNMALHQLPLGTLRPPAWALWARLPLQGVLIAWAWWYTRPSTEASG